MADFKVVYCNPRTPSCILHIAIFYILEASALSKPHNRSAALAALDDAVTAFAADCGGAFEVGAFLAQADTARIIALADRLVGEAQDWAKHIDRLEVSARRELGVHDMVVLVVQTVFDECLTVAALDVLTAAVRVALVPA